MLGRSLKTALKTSPKGIGKPGLPSNLPRQTSTGPTQNAIAGQIANQPPTGAPPANQALQRLSPGVYRDQQGALVGQNGQPLPGAPRHRPGFIPGQKPIASQAPMQAVPNQFNGYAPGMQSPPMQQPAQSPMQAQSSGNWTGVQTGRPYQPAMPSWSLAPQYQPGANAQLYQQLMQQYQPQQMRTQEFNSPQMFNSYQQQAYPDMTGMVQGYNVAPQDGQQFQQGQNVNPPIKSM